MANKLIKRRYNNLLTARRNYFWPGGSLLGDILNTPDIQGIVGQNPLDIIDLKNYSSTQAIHNVADLRNSVGTAYAAPKVKTPSKIGEFFKNNEGLTKAIGSAVGQVGGGLTNRMFGSKMNTENIAKVEANINSLNNFQSNASDFDTLADNWANAEVGMTFDNDFIGKDGWFSHKARNKANSLRDQIETGEAWVQNVLDNNANNISGTQMQNLLANYAAYGGPLFAEGGRIHIKPENRGKFTETKRRTGKTTEELTHSKNPLTRKRAIFAQNAKKWHHAFGGDLMTHGANFDTDDSLSNSDYKEGEIYDVTEEEVKILKRLGYGFEYV